MVFCYSFYVKVETKHSILYVPVDILFLISGLEVFKRNVAIWSITKGARHKQVLKFIRGGAILIESSTEHREPQSDKS